MLKRVTIAAIFIIFCISAVVTHAQQKKVLKSHTGTELSCEDCIAAGIWPAIHHTWNHGHEPDERNARSPLR